MGMHLCGYLYMFVDVSVFRVFVFGAQKSGTHLIDDFFSKKNGKIRKNRHFRPQTTPSDPAEITIVKT